MSGLGFDFLESEEHGKTRRSRKVLEPLSIVVNGDMERPYRLRDKAASAISLAKSMFSLPGKHKIQVFEKGKLIWERDRDKEKEVGG